MKGGVEVLLPGARLTEEEAAGLGTEGSSHTLALGPLPGCCHVLFFFWL